MLVSAYVPIVGHPRTAAEYGKYGEELGKLNVPKVAYYQDISDLWLPKLASSLKGGVVWSKGDNAKKNSLAYHAVQYQKIDWLDQASDQYPEIDTFVWVDYGVFHLPGVTAEAIEGFFARLRKGDFAIPGCWDKDLVHDNTPCWRFCGTVAIVPKQFIRPFSGAIKSALLAHLRFTKNIPWEVNTWARVERNTADLPIRWYKADHNVSLFDNYGISDDAQAGPGLPEPSEAGVSGPLQKVEGA